MTTINVFVRPDAGFFVTDTSIYDQRLRIVGFSTKVCHVERWPCAIACTGILTGAFRLAHLAEEYDSFDAFRADDALWRGQQNDFVGMRRALNAAFASGDPARWLADPHNHELAMTVARRWFPKDSDDQITGWFLAAASSGPDGIHRMLCSVVFVVGWSEEEGRPVGMALDLCDDARIGWQPLEDDIATQPALETSSLWRLHREGAQPWADYNGATFDPARHALPLAEAQRRQPGIAGSTDRLAAGKHMVGGSVELTTVDHRGSRTETLHHWHDTVGQPIRPGPDKAGRALPIVAPSFLDGEPEMAADWVRLWKSGGIDPKNLMPRVGNRAARRRMAA